MTLWLDAVPRKAAGDVRAYDRVETEPGLAKFVDDADGKAGSRPQPNFNVVIG